MPGDEFCNGSLDSWCGRGNKSECLLSGHNDGRNGLLFDGYSGWIVLNIPDLKHGVIALRLETWHQPEKVWKTEGWNSINNEEEGRNLATGEASPDTQEFRYQTWAAGRHGRVLKKPPPKYCESFRFDYAIDGIITSLNLEEFQERVKKVQRVVEIITLLDDRTYTTGSDQQREVAKRITG